MYYAFLRGINVSGKNQIKMSELVAAFEALGYTQVKHYLNTGNLCFHVQDTACIQLESDIEAKIKAVFDLDIPVIVKTRAAVEALVAEYPFQTEDFKNRYITLFKDRVDTSLGSTIEAAKLETDSYLLSANAVYLLIPTGYGKTKLNNNFFEKKTGLIATTRNVSTFEKVLNLG